MGELGKFEKEFIAKIREIANDVDDADATTYLSASAKMLKEIVNAIDSGEEIDNLTIGLALYFVIDLATAVKIGEEKTRDMEWYFG